MTNLQNSPQACNTGRLIFLCESALRNSAKVETNFSRAIWLAHNCIKTQLERFNHEEGCGACLAAEQERAK